MKTSSGWLAALLTTAALALAPDAWAQASDADKALARDLAKEAAQALSDKKFELARDKFARAEALYHAPTLLVGLARSYVGLGKFVEAKEAYSQVIREALPPNASDAMKQAKVDAEREVAGLDDKIGSATIQVTANGGPLPSGLAATLDDAELKQAAFGLKRPMNPGPHRLTISAPGYEDVSRRFDVGAKKETSVDVRLAKKTAAAPLPPPSSASESSAKGSAVSSSAPESSGGGTSTQAILGWSAIGLGGAGLLVGAITGGLAVKQHGELEDLCGDGKCPPNTQDRIDRYETMGAVSTAGLIAGGVFAATGVVLLVTAPKSGATSATAAPLTVGVGPSSVRATWRF